MLGYNMFTYCANNPVSCVDPSGTNAHNAAQPWLCECTSCRYGENLENAMTFFGVNSPEEIPELPDNCMLFLENIQSIDYGGITCIQGQTIVMSYDKYCVYTFGGAGIGKSVVPFDQSVTAGYVYNVVSIEDYEGLFFGASSNSILNCSGEAVALNGVYATVLAGEGYASASIGGSVTYYSSVYNNWQYGRAPISWYSSPHAYNRTFPWDSNVQL